jgi:hypothetical protein
VLQNTPPARRSAAATTVEIRNRERSAPPICPSCPVAARIGRDEFASGAISTAQSQRLSARSGQEREHGQTVRSFRVDRVELADMRRTILLPAVALAAVVVPISTAEAARTVKASAKFTVELGDQTGSYDFGQSRITKSQLAWTPQVPVSLHASPKSDPFKEFTLAGRVKKGKQPTSEAVALGLNVDVGNQSMLLSSTDGTP